MKSSMIFTLLGSAVELAGLAIAAYGFRRTWSDFGDPDDKFWGPGTRQLDRMTMWLSRIFHHRFPSRTVSAQAAVSGFAAVSAKGTVAYGKLPSITNDPQAFANMVELRLADVLARVQTVAHDLQDERESVSSQRQELIQFIERSKQEIGGAVQKVAVGGLRQQALGWFLVVIGLLFQTIGQLG